MCVYHDRYYTIIQENTRTLASLYVARLRMSFMHSNNKSLHSSPPKCQGWVGMLLLLEIFDSKGIKRSLLKIQHCPSHHEILIMQRIWK